MPKYMYASANPKPLKGITFRWPARFIEALHDLAGANRRSMSSQVLLMIERGLEAEGLREEFRGTFPWDAPTPTPNQDDPLR